MPPMKLMFGFTVVWATALRQAIKTRGKSYRSHDFVFKVAPIYHLRRVFSTPCAGESGSGGSSLRGCGRLSSGLLIWMVGAVILWLTHSGSAIFAS
jgi:hypothetical protein